jgi:hypothetical protein
MTSPNRSKYERMQEERHRLSEYESADFMGTHHEIELHSEDEDEDRGRYIKMRYY